MSNDFSNIHKAVLEAMDDYETVDLPELVAFLRAEADAIEGGR